MRAARERAEPALVDRRQQQLGGHRARLDRRPARSRVGCPRGDPGRDEHEPRGGGAGRGRGADEDRAEEEPRARPQRHGGRGQQHAGVGAEVAADDRGRGAERARRRAPPEQVGADRARDQVAEHGQRPRAHAIGERGLKIAQHVVEALRAARGPGSAAAATAPARRARPGARPRAERWSPARSQASATNAEPDAIPPNQKYSGTSHVHTGGFIIGPARRRRAGRCGRARRPRRRSRGGPRARRSRVSSPVEVRPARVAPQSPLCSGDAARPSASPKSGDAPAADRGRHVALVAHRRSLPQERGGDARRRPAARRRPRRASRGRRSPGSATRRWPAGRSARAAR